MAACEASNPRPQPKADLQSIEEILDGVRLSQTISSKDLMVLGALSKKCNLSLSDIARMVDVSGHPTTPPASPSLVAL